MNFPSEKIQGGRRNSDVYIQWNTQLHNTVEEEREMYTCIRIHIHIFIES